MNDFRNDKMRVIYYGVGYCINVPSAFKITFVYNCNLNNAIASINLLRIHAIPRGVTASWLLILLYLFA